MTMAQQLASFAASATWDDVPLDARSALKVRILDSLGCAIGAQQGPPIRAIKAEIEEFGGNPLCSLVGGGRTAPDDAALYNSALVRYLDFNDSYLAKGETCHPSDNLAAVLAAAQYAGASGADFLTALAVAYQVQCRLCDVAPVRHKYFDHVTQGAYAVAAGVSRALSLDAEATANALAIAGTALNALRVTRTSLSNWKGLAYPFAAYGATRAAFLAKRGVTGPPGVFEGRKGFMEAIAGTFEIDWASEGLEAVMGTIIKRFNAEIHSQSAIEAALFLRAQHQLDPADIRAVEIDTFDVAFSIIGGGDEGQKTSVLTKEEADHSLPYMVAVALLDGEVMPGQYSAARIASEDVQQLTRRVAVRPLDAFSERFPRQLPSRVILRLRDGRTVEREQHDYEGFTTCPTTWEAAEAKFDALSSASASAATRQRLKACVLELERTDIEQLARTLEDVQPAAITGARAQATAAHL